jgi:pyruvate/2-oxoglutarate dehydrogenase complex dihydrolipoamide acyltransferase (E2) component
LIVPRANANDDRAILVEWLADVGSFVNAGQPIAVIETTKTAIEITAPQSGYIFFSIAPNTAVEVGSCIATISDDPTRPEETPLHKDGSASLGRRGQITSKALRRIKESGLDASVFSGLDRVELADVESYIAGHPDLASRGAAVAGTVPLEQTPLKRIEAETLERVFRQVVPSTVSISLREKRVQDRLRAVAAIEGPVSLLELIIYQAARALTNVPALNGYYASGRAATYVRVAVGFAINAGHCLRVPVLHNCDGASVREIARAVRDLCLRYMRDELHPHDLVGGTFTVTDLSDLGIVHFVPVINDLQAAILGVCAVRPDAESRDLVLTFDHRMADGMLAAAFLNQLRDGLEGTAQ